MSEKSSTQTKWQKTANKVLETPKFLKKGTMVNVRPHTPPKEAEVDGRFGKRQMYIIETEDYGLIYISGLQLVNVAEALMAHNFTEIVTVEL